MEEAINLIVQLGFPVAACLLLGYFIYCMWKANREDSQKREEKNMDTITHLSGILSKNSEALLKNSEVMEKISDKIDDIDKKIDEVKKDVQEIKVRQENKDK